MDSNYRSQFTKFSVFKFGLALALMALLVFEDSFASTENSVGAQRAALDTSNSLALDYFKKDYSEAKRAFAKMAQQASKKISGAEVDFEPLSANDPELKVDTLFLPEPDAKKLLILISGTHGIEGHVGSAMQLFFLSKYVLNSSMDKDTRLPFSVLLVHGLNAHGFQSDRRVNENNVDLNRNFLVSADEFNQSNEGYDRIYDFLNPQESLSLGYFSRFTFIFRSLVLIAKNSMDTLRRAILKGQYHHPRGIYFGGNGYQIEKLALERILKRYTPSFNSALLVDFHTGYGERGRLHLLANEDEEPGAKGLEKVFGPDSIDYGNKENFYKVSGDICSYFVKRFKKADDSLSAGVAHPLALAFEYGTMNSQKPLGSIESLRRMIIENQSHQIGSASQEVKIEMEQLFREMFYPSDSDWRLSVLKQTGDAFDRIKNHF